MSTPRGERQGLLSAIWPPVLSEVTEKLQWAKFNKNRNRRYALWRIWNREQELVLFIGLDPSKADENCLDRTVTRCKNYAKRWGYGGLLMGNLYSKISTNAKAVDFHGSDSEDRRTNNLFLAAMHRVLAKTVVAWGTHAEKKIEGDFCRLCSWKPLYCLKKSEEGVQHILSTKKGKDTNLQKKYIATFNISISRATFNGGLTTRTEIKQVVSAVA